MSNACLTSPRLGLLRPVRSLPPFHSDLQSPRGRPRAPAGAGGQRGTPNKVNQSIREAIQMAFEQAGGVEYLVRLAQEDPKTFVPLLIKTIPPEPRVPHEGGLNIHIDLT
jgi:hypothetical protein